ncbi:hypothetical protein [Glaciihabitans sp. UYNi722]|uniref:hypothetical protein n=1 Tax=Glaciihabitans sp. UYNi722 TaxID=3156344 RepID=UPI003392FF0D
MRVLVVGATGILRPTAERLVAAGHDVTGVARSISNMPLDAHAIAVDAQDPGALGAALGDRRWDSAVVYSPATSPESLELLRDAVRGTFVTVVTSAAAASGLGNRPLRPGELVLGWYPSPSGARWHTAREVSDAALQVLATNKSRVLGVLSPWGDRPGEPGHQVRRRQH